MKIRSLAVGWTIAVIAGIAGIGCGGRVDGLVEGDGDASPRTDNAYDADAGASAAATAALAGDASVRAIDTRRPTSAPLAGTPLFSCDFDGGDWPEPHGNVITLSRTGATTIRLGDRELTVTVVNKTGPESGNVDYDVHTTEGESFKLSGMIAVGPANPAFPMEMVGPSGSWWACADAPGPANRDHLFDTAALDALVAATGGKTVRY